MDFFLDYLARTLTPSEAAERIEQMFGFLDVECGGAIGYSCFAHGLLRLRKALVRAGRHAGSLELSLPALADTRV